MPSERPFFTAPEEELDTTQILSEALPLAKLVAAVGVVAFIPILLQTTLFEILGLVSLFELPFTLLTQLILAVGTGIVLLYVIVRANQLADE
jgi:hypothetical protein